MKYGKLVAQGRVLEEQNRVGEEGRTDQCGSESEQQQPGPPRGQGGHSACDPVPPRFIARLFWCNEFGILRTDKAVHNRSVTLQPSATGDGRGGSFPVAA
jgi:hypothetical protein